MTAQLSPKMTDVLAGASGGVVFGPLPTLKALASRGLGEVVTERGTWRRWLVLNGEGVAAANAARRPRKVCPRCGIEQDRASAFTHRADGSVFSWCKSCNADYGRERAAKRRAEKGTL